MPCQCSKRMAAVLTRLGFEQQSENHCWTLYGKHGVVALAVDGFLYHFRLTMAAIIVRLLFGRKAKP